MRLNYQSLSSFGTDHAHSWYQLLHEYFGTLVVKTYTKGYSYTETSLIALRTYYKQASLFIILESATISERVSYATGEALGTLTIGGVTLKGTPLRYCFDHSKGGRGSVVPGQSSSLGRSGKGPKYLTPSPYNLNSLGVRLYSTRSSTKSLEPVLDQPKETSKGLLMLAKHWFVCFNRSDKVFSDLRGLLKQESLWYAAYIRLKGKKGSKTPGPDYDIIDFLTKKKILELRESVLSGKYDWIGTRRVEIPKPGKPGKTRPLGIPSINDRLVQEVLRSIIEPIWEPHFNSQSYGFRPERSCHLALKWMNTHMKDSIWYIEGDIKSYFDSIDHNKLIALIQKRIKDPLIISLVRSGLKAKVFMRDRTTFTPEVGTPQGGILSPLLSNIYLHELDLLMETLKSEYQGSTTSSTRKKNPEAHKLTRSGQKTEYYRRRIPSRIHNDPNYRNVKYLRYADDFIVGVLGPRELAVEIRDRIQEFLNKELKITLSMEKTKITHISKGIQFLGYIFTRRTLFNKQIYAGKLVTRRMTIPILDVNMEKVIARLTQAGFCDGNGDPKPVFRWLRLPQADSNVKANQILRGLSEWWSIAGNRRPAVARAAYIIRYSVAKMYAAKFKLPTVAAVFKRGTNNLSIAIGARIKSIVGVDANRDKIKGILFDRYHKIPKPKGNKMLTSSRPLYERTLRNVTDLEELVKQLSQSNTSGSKNPLEQMGRRLELTISSQGAPCEICGSYDEVDMHHVNRLSNIKHSNNPVHKHMIAIARTQIPLCNKHHLEAHRGNWQT